MVKKDVRMTVSPTNRELLAALVVWSVTWKGFSLWRAAKDDSKPWFVTLLLSNTVGVLDAIYIFGVSRHRRRAAHGEISTVTAPGEPEQVGHTQET